MAVERLPKPFVPPLLDLKRLRRKLKLSQPAFAITYMIPLGTLRSWEHDRRVPDYTARCYLKLIEAEPQLVADTIRKVREDERRMA